MARGGAVLLTGASTGIGRATALLLCRRGFRVFAGVRRDEDAASLASEAGAGLLPLRFDVTDARQVAAAVAEVESAVGADGLQGLVNNAGVGCAFPLEFVDLGEVRQVFEVNVFGLLAVTQACLPLLRRGRGRVVNVSSIGGRMANPFLGPYAGSKFAVEALSDSLRQELRPFGLEVVVIEPGTIDTPIFAKTLADVDAALARLPEQSRALYQPDMDALRRFVLRNVARAIPPEVVARDVFQALTAPRPRTRYIQGRDAKVQALLARLVPDRIIDAAKARLLGLRGRGSAR